MIVSNLRKSINKFESSSKHLKLFSGIVNELNKIKQLDIETDEDNDISITYNEIYIGSITFDKGIIYLENDSNKIIKIKFDNNTTVDQVINSFRSLLVDVKLKRLL